MTNWNPKRAENYNKLEWINDTNQLDVIADIINSRKPTFLLEVGCGTGQLTEYIKNNCHPLVFTAIDPSIEMLEQAKQRNLENVNFQLIKIEDLESFHGFDLIVMRNVLHHIEDMGIALEKCKSLLRKHDGCIVIIEGIPAANGYQLFHDALTIKEDRHIFSIGELSNIIEIAGFRQQKIFRSVFKDLSLANILDNDGTLSNDKKEQIYELYQSAFLEEIKAYNIRSVNNDFICDFAWVAIQGIEE